MRTHVVIIGAGYAGVMTAKRLLRRSSDIAVTVVNPRDHFVQRIRLHQMVTGNYDATLPLVKALPPQAKLVVAAATSIDAANRHVVLDDGAMLHYDFLVYAAGSRQSGSTIAGAAAHGYGLSVFEDATRLKNRLSTLPSRASICVVGGGLTGIETAAELAGQRRGRVTLITGEALAQSLSEKGQSAIARALIALGVDVVSGSRVVRIDEHACELSDGGAVAADCTILTTEFSVPDLASHSGLPVDDRGRLQVNRQLECVTHKSIVGAGDSVTIADMSLRMSCQTAIPLGVHAADTIMSRLDGSDPNPVVPRFFGQCVSLGRKKAVFQLTSRTDKATKLVIAGLAGALIKEQICASTVDFAITPRHPIFYGWT